MADVKKKKQPAKGNPKLFLAGPKVGLPTVDDLAAMVVALTGRQPTEAELEETRRILSGEAE